MLESGLDAEKMVEILEEATKYRQQDYIVTVQPLKKNVKRQKQLLAENGYDDIRVVRRAE